MKKMLQTLLQVQPDLQLWIYLMKARWGPHKYYETARCWCKRLSQPSFILIPMQDKLGKFFLQHLWIVNTSTIYIFFVSLASEPLRLAILGSILPSFDIWSLHVVSSRPLPRKAVG